MKLRYTLFMVFFCLCLGAVIWIFLPSAPDVREQTERVVSAAQEADLSGARPENVVVLSVTGVDLRQGEQGRELWRLRADAGNMRRDDGLLILTGPKFVYHMRNNGLDLTIDSRSGDVDQKGAVVRFVDDVRVAYDENFLNAKIMAYNGDSRVLSFPEAAVFRNGEMAGEALYINWLLKENLIVAGGGVVVRWADEAKPGDARSVARSGTAGAESPAATDTSASDFPAGIVVESPSVTFYDAVSATPENDTH